MLTFRNYLYHITLPLVIFLLSLTIASCDQQQQTQNNPQVITLPAIQVRSYTIPVYIDYIGITKSIAQVDIRARVKGFLVERNFTDGTFVSKDQLLFVIDPRDYQAQLKQAKAQLELTKAQLEYNKIEYERMKKLYIGNNVSKEKVDQTKAEYEESVAQMHNDVAKLAQAKLNLSYCYMYAPINGKIGERLVDVGNLVGGSSDTKLATIVQLNPIYVVFTPSVSDFGEFLKYRQNSPFPVAATLPEDKKLRFSGKIDFVNNEASQNTSTILMRATLKNPDKLLLPGIYVNVRVILGKAPGTILIPQAAILETQGKQFVYIIQNNKVVARNIKSTKNFSNQSVVESGLKVGDIVAVKNLQKVHPDDPAKAKMINNDIPGL